MILVRVLNLFTSLWNLLHTRTPNDLSNLSDFGSSAAYVAKVQNTESIIRAWVFFMDSSRMRSLAK